MGCKDHVAFCYGCMQRRSVCLTGTTVTQSKLHMIGSAVLWGSQTVSPTERMNRSDACLGCGLGCMSELTMYYNWRPDPPEEREFGRVIPPLKCISLCKQQIPQWQGVADLFRGDSVSRRKGGSKSSVMVTNAGAIRRNLSSKFFDKLLFLFLNY